MYICSINSCLLPPDESNSDNRLLLYKSYWSAVTSTFGFQYIKITEALANKYTLKFRPADLSKRIRRVYKVYTNDIVHINLRTNYIIQLRPLKRRLLFLARALVRVNRACHYIYIIITTTTKHTSTWDIKLSCPPSRQVLHWAVRQITQATTTVHTSLCISYNHYTPHCVYRITTTHLNVYIV